MVGEEDLKLDKKEEELAFVVPTDVSFEAITSELSNEMLQRYHDVMHILWNKLQDGLGEFGEFKWTFNKVIVKHSEIVREMLKRGIKHFTPINKLDFIQADIQEDSIVELSKKDSIIELSKKEKKKENISFEPGSINRINKQ